MDGNPELARIRNLLKDLPGETGNGGEMSAWVDPGDADSMPEHVRGLIAGAMRSCCPGLIPAGAGVSDAARKPPLDEVDEATATEFLTQLLSTGLVYSDQGKYPKGKAQDISTTLARLLGPGRAGGPTATHRTPGLRRRTTRSMPLSLA